MIYDRYDYVAMQLASWGYVVVSINANRGITCGYGIPGGSSNSLVFDLFLYYK
jgi:hypothetical protein